MGVLKNIQATGTKQMNSLKVMNINKFTVIIGLLILSGSIAGAALLNHSDEVRVTTPELGQTANNDPLIKSATDIDNDIANFEKYKTEMGIGEARAETQDIQQRITNLWIEADRASGLTEDEAARERHFIKYLSESSKVVTSMQAGEVPDLVTYNKLFQDLTGKESRITLAPANSSISSTSPDL